MFNPIFLAVCDLVRSFCSHDLKYLVGGSVSSSLNGIFRTTNDIDVLVAKSLDQVPLLIKALSSKFLIDEPALISNHKVNRAYNIFHEETALKIDLFPAHTEFHLSEINRAISVKPPSAPCSFKIASAEDIILAKLVWLKKSHSDRQSSDINGVFHLNKNSLDYNYITDWAERLGVSNELKAIIIDSK